MLFTSAHFFCLYLPIVFAGFYAIGRFSERGAAAWLGMASLFFYGYWMPEFVVLLLASIGWNFWVGTRIGHYRASATVESQRIAKRWLTGGITVDLLLLAYFKYAGFFVANLNALLGQEWSAGNIILPIGISFYTFTQIAFLADAFQKGTREYQLIHYGLFVTYFPHLIAGPVLHHAQMMPQFRLAETYRLSGENVAAGLAIFALGLFKKIVLADGISPYADAVFNGAQAGFHPDALEAWIGALAYTFQLYFDFSGYSDMAIGLSWMFNVRLPFNFDSPYKAVNISDFWRRWHMTLSAFLRDYLYIPLGGNRLGPWRRYVNLFVTMLLGGLWHGASWTFVFWGALHGAYLTLNHGFQAWTEKRFPDLGSHRVFRLVAWGLTFIAVVVAWVFFRSPDFATATTMLASMAGVQWLLDGSQVHALLWNSGLQSQRGLLWFLFLAGVAFLMPNSNRIGEGLLLWLREQSAWAPVLLGAALALSSFLVLINTARDSVSAFIYFNF